MRQKNSVQQLSRIIFFGLIAFISQCCSEDDVRPLNEGVDIKLRPYLNAFIEEATARGYKINAEALTLRFGKHPQADAAANFNTFTITIDSTSYDWQAGFREQLLFHEFGHLFLGRNHDDTLIGIYPKSIMAGEADPSYESWKSPKVMRSYYINELFNPNTARPDWSY